MLAPSDSMQIGAERAGVHAGGICVAVAVAVFALVVCRRQSAVASAQYRQLARRCLCWYHLSRSTSFSYSLPVLVSSQS